MRLREITNAERNQIRGPVVIIGMIALMALGAACSGNGGITEEDVTGIWHVQNYGSFQQINDDGTYSIAQIMESLDDGPLEAGQWTLDGAVFTMISSDESEVCAAGERGIYEVELIDENRMTHVRQEDACSRRSTSTINLERVDPEKVP